VLVEDPDGAVQWACARNLTAAGYDVAVCAGPQGMGRKRCPAVTTGSCSLAAEADVIYSSLRWSDPGSRAVLTALRAACPGTPLVVEAPQPQLAEHRELRVADVIVPVPADAAGMRRAITDALAPTAREGAPAVSR
jgi:hypothetical protein